MLLWTALLAVVIAGIVYGGWAAWIGACICVMGLFSQLIAAIVGVGQHRAIAISFLLPATCYLVSTTLISDAEYSYANGILPHSQWMQRSTREELQKSYIEFKNSDERDYVDDESYVAQLTIPRMVLIHVFTALVMGVIGGCYGRLVYVSSRDDKA